MYGPVYEAGSATRSEAGRPAAPALTSQLEAQIQLRVRAALGPDADPIAAERLAALYASALLDAGEGYATHTDGSRSIDHVAHRILNRH
ncbi:hypothetical protein [Nocardia macrotermitis]|uniref:TetR family transcriptional regulator n=1 Tax=Nocardia macrotermitis TaxID=2585198 RepID=A0A7K0CUD7_9NOCA|nr:hypothetical protein [Nocardia macrotermitis]MQY17097.1 hypothetical protein [Nocardia macrotermitis]